MLKSLLGLFGAGSIAGLLPFAPWIIAALIALVGAGGWLYQSHQLDNEKVNEAKIAADRDAAYTKLGTVQGALQTSNDTIAAMQANDAANDALIDNLQHQIDDNARVSIDAGKQIRNLQDADPDVDTYLRRPIPCSLRAILNEPPGPASATCGADKDGGGAPAKAIAVPVPAG